MNEENPQFPGSENHHRKKSGEGKGKDRRKRGDPPYMGVSRVPPVRVSRPVPCPALSRVPPCPVSRPVLVSYGTGRAGTGRAGTGRAGTGRAGTGWQALAPPFQGDPPAFFDLMDRGQSIHEDRQLVHAATPKSYQSGAESRETLMTFTLVAKGRKFRTAISMP